MADVFEYRDAGVAGLISDMKTEEGKLKAQQQDMFTADKQLAGTWQGDAAAKWLGLQNDFSRAFDEFNTAFDKFIATTTSNAEAVRATETRMQNAIG